MFERIILRNFRGIAKGELELSPLTILVGANNSGKTTILEALFLVPNPFRPTPYALGDRNEAVAILQGYHETLGSDGYGFLLHGYVADKVTLAIVEEGVMKAIVFAKQGGIIRVHFHEEVKDIEVLGKPGAMEVGSLHKDSFSFPSTPVHRGPLTKRDALLVRSDLLSYALRHLDEMWDQVANRGIGRRAAETISEFVAEGYDDLTLEPILGRKSLNVRRRADGRRVRVRDLGDGIQSALMTQILYELQEPGVLLWDDVEAHMNPHALLLLAGWFADLIEAGVQVVVSTHSLEAMKILASGVEDVVKDEALIRLLYLGEDRVLKSRSLSLSEVEKYEAAGADVRMAESLLM